MKRIGSIEYFDENKDGRDFICGDIHGDIKALYSAMKSVGFNKKVDRIFCCGDIVDRGNSNIEALEMLEKDYFFSTLGNHEVLFESTDPIYDKNKDYEIEINRKLHKENGGNWIEKENVLNKHYELVVDLPIAINIFNKNKNVFLTHTFVENYSYEDVVSEFEKIDNAFDLIENSRVAKRFLWDRIIPEDVKILINESTDSLPLVRFKDCGEYYELYIDKKIDVSKKIMSSIIELSRRHNFKFDSNVDVDLFVGHSIVQNHFYLDKPVKIENVMYMDTGSSMGGYLSFYEI